MVRAPHLMLVFSHAQDSALAPYTNTLAKWALEKETRVLVGTRFVLDMGAMRPIETFGAREMTLLGRFYLRLVQLAPGVPPEIKKKLVPLFVPIRIDLWTANLEDLFASGEQMANTLANFDSTEHHRPKEIEEGAKNREVPGVVHAVYDEFVNRLYQRNRARSISGMLFVPAGSSSSASTSSSSSTSSGVVPLSSPIAAAVEGLAANVLIVRYP